MVEHLKARSLTEHAEFLSMIELHRATEVDIGEVVFLLNRAYLGAGGEAGRTPEIAGDDLALARYAAAA